MNEQLHLNFSSSQMKCFFCVAMSEQGVLLMRAINYNLGAENRVRDSIFCSSLPNLQTLIKTQVMKDCILPGSQQL